MVAIGYAGTYTLGASSFVVASDGNNIQWEGSSNVFLSTVTNNVGTTNNSSSPLLKRVFAFNDVGAPSKSWPIHYNDTALTRLNFTSTGNNGWVGTWTNSRDGSFTIQQPVAGTYTLTRNGTTHSCLFIDATNLTNVMPSHFDSSTNPAVLVKTATSAVSVILNASNGAWAYALYNKTS